jgi:hypothetical protein
VFISAFSKVFDLLGQVYVVVPQKVTLGLGNKNWSTYSIKL